MLRELGVGPGDRGAGYVPNAAEAVIALLATASLGAIWSGCGQDYSPAAAAERLGQLEPAVLIAADGYRYGGRAAAPRAAGPGPGPPPPPPPPPSLFPPPPPPPRTTAPQRRPPPPPPASAPAPRPRPR